MERTARIPGPSRVMVATLVTTLGVALAAGVGACSGQVYLRDGVTDGDTFYLPARALSDPDPVLQSWVRYSLARSTCQLGIGGDNPARATSFDCELTARQHLVDAWAEHRRSEPVPSDGYLDSIAAVDAAGFLREYVAYYLARGSWQLPQDLDAAGFGAWRRLNLRNHDAKTRLVGSWNYARNVGGRTPGGPAFDDAQEVFD